MILNSISKNICVSLHEYHISISILSIRNIITIDSIELLEVISLDDTWIVIL